MVTFRCNIGRGTEIIGEVDLYNCTIGNNCKIGPYTIIEGGVKVGNNVIIKGLTYIPTGVTIEDNVFIGHGTCFTNDKHPKVGRKKWKMETTKVEHDASIGVNCTILCGLTIGAYSIIGAGSIITKDVKVAELIYGKEARPRINELKEYGL